MDYLERNRALLQEISGVRLTSGPVIGTSLAVWGETKTTFTSLGHYSSAFLQRELYIGLKRSGGNTEERFACELAIIRAIAHRFPSLECELPSFYGLLTSDGGTLGIIMEDFSEGGRYPVEEVAERYVVKYPHHVPPELFEFFPDSNDEYEYAKACFLVNGRRRLGDFDTLITRSGWTEIGVSELIERRSDFEVRIDYDLEL